jgi:hypothetical protein
MLVADEKADQADHHAGDQQQSEQGGQHLDL